MSPGKLAAQVSHGSMAYLTNLITRTVYPCYAKLPDGSYDLLGYKGKFYVEKRLYEEWINGIFTKVVLEAKNKNDLLKAQILAEGLGMKKDVDFFLIYDVCNTELQPEEEDETTLTCIGFKPMPSEVIDQIGKKYQLYKG